MSYYPPGTEGSTPGQVYQLGDAYQSATRTQCVFADGLMPGRLDTTTPREPGGVRNATPGVWQLITATYYEFRHQRQSQSASLYENGVCIQSNDATSGPPNSGSALPPALTPAQSIAAIGMAAYSTLYIGNGWGTRDNEWIGGLSNIGIWNVCLTGATPNPSTTLALPAHWAARSAALYNTPTCGIAALPQYGVSAMDKLFTLYDGKLAAPAAVTTGNGTLGWKYVAGGLPGNSGDAGQLTARVLRPAQQCRRRGRDGPARRRQLRRQGGHQRPDDRAGPLRPDRHDVGPGRVHRRRHGGHQRPDDRAGPLRPEAGSSAAGWPPCPNRALLALAGRRPRRPVGRRLAEAEIARTSHQVCHCLEQAVPVAGLATHTACSKQWHTAACQLIDFQAARGCEQPPYASPCRLNQARRKKGSRSRCWPRWAGTPSGKSTRTVRPAGTPSSWPTRSAAPVAAQGPVEPYAGVAQRRDGQQHVLHRGRAIFGRERDAAQHRPRIDDAGNHRLGRAANRTVIHDFGDLLQQPRVVDRHEGDHLLVLGRGGLDARLHDFLQVLSRHQRVGELPAMAVAFGNGVE